MQVLLDRAATVACMHGILYAQANPPSMEPKPRYGPDQKRVTLVLERVLWMRLRMHAIRNDTTLQDLFVASITAMLDRDEKPPEPGDPDYTDA